MGTRIRILRSTEIFLTCLSNDFLCELYDCYRTMIVAVSIVWVMEMAIDEVINVVAVRNGLMTTTRTMNMISIVSIAYMIGCTNVGVGVIDIQSMFIDMITVWVMEVTIV